MNTKAPVHKRQRFMVSGQYIVSGLKKMGYGLFYEPTPKISSPKTPFVPFLQSPLPPCLFEHPSSYYVSPHTTPLPLACPTPYAYPRITDFGKVCNKAILVGSAGRLKKVLYPFQTLSF